MPYQQTDFVYNLDAGRIQVEIAHHTMPHAKVTVLEPTGKRDFMTDLPGYRVLAKDGFAMYPYVNIEAFITFLSDLLTACDEVTPLTLQSATHIVHKVFAQAGVGTGGLVVPRFSTGDKK